MTAKDRKILADLLTRAVRAAESNPAVIGYLQKVAATAEARLKKKTPGRRRPSAGRSSARP